MVAAEQGLQQVQRGLGSHVVVPGDVRTHENRGPAVGIVVPGREARHPQRPASGRLADRKQLDLGPGRGQLLQGRGYGFEVVVGILGCNG